MPSIKQSADFLKRAKEENQLEPVASPIRVPEGYTPDAPTYPEAPNSRLRSPMPANLVLQPDSQRQWFNPSTPQTRLLSPTLASSPFNGSAIQSTIATSSNVSPVNPVIPPIPPATDTFYEVNGDGNFEVLYSINGVPF